MAKVLNYVEFRYTDGRKQCLRGKEAQEWMDFTKRKMAIAHTIDKTFDKKWTWSRYLADEVIPDRPGVVPPPEVPENVDFEETNYNEYD